MLIVETIAKIRRLNFTQGLQIKTICRELNLSKMVVRSWATEFRYKRCEKWLGESEHGG